MTKANRQKVFDKFGGRCAYCGCELEKGWHVDEIEPVRRRWKTIKGGYIHPDKTPVTRDELRGMSEEDMNAAGVKWRNDRTVLDGMDHPERMCIENQNPACASCNINKHSDTLEGFRSSIAGYMKHLNKVSTQYKIAKRYRLIIETNKPVVFYFEKVNIKKKK